MSETRPKRKVLLIGCGTWSFASHLPALRRYAGVIELALCDIKTRAAKDAARYWGKPLLQDSIYDCLPTHSSHNCFPENDVMVKTLAANENEQALVNGVRPDGIIIATPPTEHFEYAQAAIEAKIPLLVDKPLTVTPECSTDVQKAKNIYDQYETLVEKAREANLQSQFMLGVQKRYQEAYVEIGKRVRETYSTTGFPVTSVQLYTNDGYWILPKEFAELEYHGYAPKYGGGKITHTGYHFLDIIPWIMRHAWQGCSPIHHAWVTTHLFRPTDSIGLYPPSMFPPEYEKLDPYSDVNAFIIVQLRDVKNRARCVIQMSMMHEGFSLRRSTADLQTAHTEGRTKIDSLAVWQGPVMCAFLRRVGKIKATDGNSPGEKNHLELQFITRTEAGSGQVEDFRLHDPASDPSEGCGDDLKPTLEFLDMLTNPSITTKSPVNDHGIGIRILSAAYESAAAQYQDDEKRPTPVKIIFRDDEWRAPPGL